MTEQIKCAIEGLKFLCECGEIGLTDEEKQPIQLSIRSLKAWEEVLNELEKKNALYMSYLSNKENPYDSELFGKHIAVENCIDIINQHLAEIEE